MNAQEEIFLCGARLLSGRKNHCQGFPANCDIFITDTEERENPETFSGSGFYIIPEHSGFHFGGMQGLEL
jgi:hypothetical protein